jgi:hypothetical protein
MAAAASAGICTTLKYQSRPIQTTPDRMCSQRARLSSPKAVGSMASERINAATNPVVIAPRTVLNGFMLEASEGESGRAL